MTYKRHAGARRARSGALQRLVEWGGSICRPKRLGTHAWGRRSGHLRPAFILVDGDTSRDQEFVRPALDGRYLKELGAVAVEGPAVQTLAATLEFQRDHFNLWCYGAHMKERRHISAWLNGFDELGAAATLFRRKHQNIAAAFAHAFLELKRRIDTRRASRWQVSRRLP